MQEKGTQSSQRSTEIAEKNRYCNSDIRLPEISRLVLIEDADPKVETLCPLRFSAFSASEEKCTR